MTADLVARLEARASRLCGPDAAETVALLREAASALRSRGEALWIAREALADAANTMYAICGESQFCYSCTAFERANQWRQDWHGGDRLLQQITAAIPQEDRND